MLNRHIGGDEPWRSVLLATPDRLPGPWLGNLDGVLAPQRVGLFRTASRRQTIERLQAGGIDLAVLMADSAGVSGLRTLEIVRLLTPDLPCLLVTSDPSGPTLRRALELEAYSVVRQPVDLELMVGLLLRILRTGRRSGTAILTNWGRRPIRAADHVRFRALWLRESIDVKDENEAAR